MSAIVQLTPDEKLQRVLEEIAEELHISPAGQPLEIHRSHESDVAVVERHYQAIITKLEQEEKVIKVLPDNRKEGSFSKEWGYPSRFARLEVLNPSRLREILKQQRDITKLSSDALNVKVQKAATWWGMSQDERRLHTLMTPNNTPLSFPLNTSPIEVTPLAPASVNNVQVSTHQALTATYNRNVGVLINDIFRLTKPQEGSENERVIDFLIAHPNKDHSRKDMEAAIRKVLKKNLYDIVRGLGFEGDLMKLFFPRLSQNVVRFKNPVTREDMQRLGISFLPIAVKPPKTQKKLNSSEVLQSSHDELSSESEETAFKQQ